MSGGRTHGDQVRRQLCAGLWYLVFVQNANLRVYGLTPTVILGILSKKQPGFDSHW